MKHVGRGLFQFCRFTDSYGAVVRVQTSSSAERTAAWVFIAGGGSANDERLNDGAAHLTRGQAKRLRDGLDKWLRATEPARRPARRRRDG